MNRRKTPFVYTDELMLEEIDICGFTFEYFNEVSGCSKKSWQKDYARLQAGKVRTYSQRYATKSEIMLKSDEMIVSRLDYIVSAAMDAACTNDEAKARKLWENIKYLKVLHISKELKNGKSK